MTKTIYAAADNPCGEEISRVTHGLMIPHSLIPKQKSLLGQTEDGRHIQLYSQWDGDSGETYYTGYVRFKEGEKHLRFEVVDAQPAWKPMPLHPAVYDPANPESLKELIGKVEGFVVNAEGVAESVFDYTMTLGPAPEYLTAQQTRWHGYQKSKDNPFRVDFWIDVSAGSPEIPIELNVWACGTKSRQADGGTYDEPSRYPLDYCVITWGEEIRSPYEVAHGHMVGEGGKSITIVNRMRYVTRGTRGMSIVGSLLCRVAASDDIDADHSVDDPDHEDYLRKCRAGISRAMIIPECLDGHIPGVVNIPRWEASNVDLERAELEDLRYKTRPASIPNIYDGWFKERVYGDRLNPDAPGDGQGFGNISNPLLFADPDSGRSVSLLDRMLSDAIGDGGNRQVHHLVDGEPWEWEWGCNVATWEGMTDERYAGTHPNMLGGRLPNVTEHYFTTHDSEHQAGPGPLMAWITGSPLMRSLLHGKAQMAYAYVRATKSMTWVGVSRATGRQASWMADAASPLGDLEKIEPALRDLIEDAMAGSHGYNNDTAWMTPIVAQNFAGTGLSNVPYTEGLGMQLLHVYRLMDGKWEDEEGSFQDRFRDALITWSRGSIRAMEFNDAWPLSIGTYYSATYTTQEEPVPIPDSMLSGDELYSAWAIAAPVMAYLELCDDHDTDDYRKALAIVAAVKAKGLPSANYARWWVGLEHLGGES